MEEVRLVRAPRDFQGKMSSLEVGCSGLPVKSLGGSLEELERSDGELALVIQAGSVVRL